MNQNRLDIFGYLLIGSFFTLLTYAGYLSYKSIDWDILKRLESQQLVLPTPIPAATSASPSAVTSSITATPSR